MYRPNTQKWHEMNYSNEGREDRVYMTGAYLPEFRTWAPTELRTRPKLTETELADYKKLQDGHTAEEKFTFSFVSSEIFLASIGVSSAPSSSTLKTKEEFIAELALRRREEELKKKKSVKESKSKSSRKRARKETTLKDEEVEVTPAKIPEEQAGTPNSKQAQLESTAEYPPTVMIQDTPPRAESQHVDVAQPTITTPTNPFVSMSNTGPITELCSDNSIILGREVGKALQVHQDVRMTDLTSYQRAGQASAHVMQTQLWVESLVQDLSNTQDELGSTKDALKIARKNNFLWRNKVTELEGRITSYEGKLNEAQNLYSEAQKTGLENMEKLEKQISELQIQVNEANARANVAEAEWFSKGQDNRVRAAKATGLD